MPWLIDNRRSRTISSLDRLFRPRSIAVVGASEDTHKAGYQMLYALRGFPGKLYPINPKADEILGFKVYHSIGAVESSVDLMILTIPAKACARVLAEAGECNVGAALIISGGFGETGETGKSVEDDIVAVCRRYNIRLLGPNTAGFGNPKAGVFANFTPWIGRLEAGPIGIVSQSGAMNLILASLVQRQRLGISLATGIGNGVDVGVAHVVEYLADDPDTKVIALYLEGVREGRRLFEAIRSATAKKPVIAFPVGQADVKDFAVSHTGNLMGSFALKKAALVQAGAVVVSSGDDLVDAANLLSKVRLEPGLDPGVGLLTGQAGPGMVIADHLRSHSVTLPALDRETVEKIGRLIPPMTFIKNPVDTGRPSHTFRDVLLAMAADTHIDVLVTFAIHEPAVVDPVGLFREVKESVKQPIVFGTSGFPDDISPVQRALESINIASFASPDRTARATWALVEDAKAAYRTRRRADEPLKALPAVGPFEVTPDEATAKSLLNTLGIPTPPHRVCETREEVKNAWHAFGGVPCALKILAPGIVHKTEVEGVHLDIMTEEELLRAFAAIDRIAVEGKRRYLLEKMAPKGLEMMIGAKNDPSFGPTVLIGRGGTEAEAVQDVALRLAPLSLSDARQMMGELKSSVLFDGWRSGASYDREAFAETVVTIGELINGHPEIREMDLNPVRVHEKGVSVLDAVMVCV